jgi:hypothetical protein
VRYRTSQQHTARSNALPAIAATHREVQRAAGHRSNVTRSSALLAITATLRRPARCWPSQQRCNVQRVVVTAPQKCCKLQCVADQHRNNATSCNAPSHRCSVARKRRHPPLPQRRLSSTRPTFVGRPLDFRPTFVGRPSNFRRTSVGFSSDFRRTSVPLSSVERPTYVTAYVIADVTADVIVLPFCLHHC